MYENKTENKEEIEIDLSRLARTLLNKAWLIAIVAVVCAVVTFLGTFFFVTPMYTSSVMFYVNNSAFSLGEASLNITSSDISASKSLVNTYIVILNTRETLNEVIDYSGVDLTYPEIKEMISAEVVDDTQVFRVTVTGPDPAQAQKVADAIASVLPKRISSIIDGTSAQIVDSAVVPSRPSSPNYTKNTLIGFALGLGAAMAVIVLWDLFDVTIRTEEDVERSSKHPVLAAVPDMGNPGKGGGKQPSGPAGEPEVIGGNIPFAASEAYKLLRTKVQFAFAGDKNCRVIGVSSALAGEGKSVSSVNLAYALSQLDKRVLLIDCDMRWPSLAAKLPIRKNPGLSDYLTGQNHGDDLIQLCGMEKDACAFHVISAGRNPPNPMELLSSARMEKLLTLLKQNYEYIILDLPPVGEVGDALTVARFTDGMLIVVRRNCCNRIALSAAERQFAFVDAKIIGVVYNCAAESGGAYGKKYYKKYGSKCDNGKDAAAGEP